MQPTAVCLAAFLWFTGHSPVVARSGSPATALTQDFHIKKLRGRVSSLHLSAKPDDDKEEADKPKAQKRRRTTKGEKKGSKTEGKSKGEAAGPGPLGPIHPVVQQQVNGSDNLAEETIDQATKTPARKEFDAVDRDGDEEIDLHEYLASTRAGTRVATYRFNCSDSNVDGGLDFKEFEFAQAHPEDLQKCLGMIIAFQMVDKNRDGYLEQHELWSNVGGPSFDSRWAFMVACSDTNGDGKVSPMEFTKDMYGCMEEKSNEAYKDFGDFKNADTSGDGCADEEEMSVAINKLFGLNLISDKPPKAATMRLTRRWMNCVDFDSNRCLSKKEYNEGLLDPSPEEAQCIGDGYERYEADMDFEIMDSNDDGRVSKQEYYTYCGRLDIEIDQKEADALFTSADKNKNGFIEENEFNSAGEEHKGDGPGYLFFLRQQLHTPSLTVRSRASWRGSIKKTWAGVFNPSK